MEKTGVTLQLLNNARPLTTHLIVALSTGTGETWVRLYPGSASMTGADYEACFMNLAVLDRWWFGKVIVRINGVTLSAPRPVTWYAEDTGIMWSGITHFPLVDAREGSPTAGYFSLAIRGNENAR